MRTETEIRATLKKAKSDTLEFGYDLHNIINTLHWVLEEDF